jgi:anti-sigma factor RsiW
MSTMNPEEPSPDAGSPVSEADLHGYVDGQLPAWRYGEVERYLASRADERARVEAWRRHKELLHDLLDPVLREPLPPRLPIRRQPAAPAWRGLAAGLAIAALSASAAWWARGAFDRESGATPLVAVGPSTSASAPGAAGGELAGFALRAAVAHALYSPEQRHPVEVGADQEQHLVAWLSKRLGTPIKVPGLKAIGYELVGGRLLPGDTGPVAQFMYHDGSGQRLTLYVTRQPTPAGRQATTAFRFGQDGPVNVFYWIDKDFGYALSGAADRRELTRVADEVYRQLGGS